MHESRKQNYLHGAAILAIGVVIMKILGAIYKIPLSNILGDAGFGHFNAAYSIYNVLLTTSTTGLPVALSRMVSEANTLGRPRLVSKTFRVALLTFAGFGAVFSLVTLLFPSQMAVLLLNKPESAASLAALAPAVLLVYLTSAFRGYIQGHSDMKPTTISQIIEVLVKVIVGLTLAKIVISRTGDTPSGAAAAIFGVTAGSLAALVYIAFSYFKLKKHKDTRKDTAALPANSEIFVKLIKIGVPIALGASVLSIISLIDTKLVNSQLLASGLGKSLSDTLYGSYSVMTSLYNLPAAFITPLTISVVPAISAAVAAKNHESAGNIAESSMRISSVVAMPMCVGLSFMSYPIVKVLYRSTHEVGPTLLTLLGIASMFVCLALITSAILQANGNERIPMYSMLIGGSVKLIISWVLVGNPKINIIGAPIGTIVCYAIMFGINAVYLKYSMKYRPQYRRAVIRPLVSSLVMGIGALGSYYVIALILGGPDLSRGKTALALFPAIAIAVVLYVLLINITKAVTSEDLKLIPKGEKIAAILRIK